MLIIGHLNNSIADIGSPDPSGVALICDKARYKARYASVLVSEHFFSIHLMNLIHALTCCFDGGMMINLLYIYESLSKSPWIDQK